MAAPYDSENARHDSRLPVKLGIDLRVGDRPQQRGSIRKLGADGALLGQQGIPAALPPGSRLRLGLRLPPTPEGRHYRIDARLIERGRQGVTVRFLEPPAPFVAAVQDFLARQQAEESARQQRLEARRAPLRAALRRAVMQQIRLDQRADRLIEHAVRALREGAAGATDDATRTRCNDDAAVLEQAWHNQGLGFALTALWLRPLQPEPNSAGGSSARATALLGDADTDIWIVRQALIDDLERDCHGQLAAYRDQAGMLSDDPAALPFVPAQLVDALITMVDLLGLTDKSRLQILQQSSRLLLSLCRCLYPGLLQTLAEK